MRAVSKSLLSVGALTLTLIGCAAADAGSGTSDDLTVDVITARSCAVRDGYRAATLADLTPVSYSELPNRLKEALENTDVAATYARFTVASVGSVFIVQPTGGTSMSFYDVSGRPLVSAAGAADGLAWMTQEHQPLVCPAEAADAGVGVHDGGSGPHGHDAGAEGHACGTPDGGHHAFLVCASTCVDLFTDKHNCGRCGHACYESDECREGACHSLG